MKRLLHVFSTFCAAGPQVRFASVAKRLGNEFSHTVVALDGNYEAAGRVDPNVALVCLPPPTKGTSLASAFRFRELICRQNPDLVLTYNWGAIEAVAGAKLAGPYPVIHTEDGFNPDEATQLKRRRVLTRRVLLKHIHSTVVPSYTLLEIARRAYRIPVGKVQLIPNGIDCDRFAPRGRDESRAKLGFRPDTFLIGTIGHLRPEKDLGLLIRAFGLAGLPNSRLLLVGDGKCRVALEALARELGLKERIQFTGACDDPRPYLNAFDLFAMSSYTEQMPMSLLEAMASALPVVCTDVGDCGRMLESRDTPLLVPSGNVEAFSRALLTLAANPDLRRAIGNRNRDRCTARYSVETMVRSYANLYRQAVGDVSCSVSGFSCGKVFPPAARNTKS